MINLKLEGFLRNCYGSESFRAFKNVYLWAPFAENFTLPSLLSFPASFCGPCDHNVESDAIYSLSCLGGQLVKSLKSFIVPKVLGWRGGRVDTLNRQISQRRQVCFKKKRLKKLDVCILVFVGVSSHCVWQKFSSTRTLYLMLCNFYMMWEWYICTVRNELTLGQMQNKSV